MQNMKIEDIFDFLAWMSQYVKIESPWAVFVSYLYVAALKVPVDMVV